jgi:hypothetical protein
LAGATQQVGKRVAWSDRDPLAQSEALLVAAPTPASLVARMVRSLLDSLAKRVHLHKSAAISSNEDKTDELDCDRQLARWLRVRAIIAGQLGCELFPILSNC